MDDRVTLDITLPIGPLAQQVVVSASATILPESQVGASVTVLDQRVLESFRKPDVLEALRLVPGAQVVHLGQTITIHGANGTSATGRAILDFAGRYPQTVDSSTTRRALTAQTEYALSGNLSLSGGGRFEDETGFTDSGTRSTTTRHNGGAFVEGRGSFGERLYLAGGVGLDHNAVFGFAATPRVSVASYLRRPSGGAAIGDTKLVFNAGKGIKAPSISQEHSSLFGLLTSAFMGAALIRCADRRVRSIGGRSAVSACAEHGESPRRAGRESRAGVNRGLFVGRQDASTLNQHYEAALGFPALPMTVRTGLALTLSGPRGIRE